MHALETYDYAVIRVVPRVERGEFVNAGILLSRQRPAFLQARIHLDAARVLALDPGADIETIRRHLDAIPAICRNGNRGPTADSSKATAATRPKTSTKAQRASTTGFSSSRPAISGKETTFQVIRADAPRAG